MMRGVFLPAFCLAISLSSIQVVEGAPFFLLVSKAAKCMKIDVPRETMLIFEYKAPDLLLLSDEEMKQSESGDAFSEGDGMDARYNENRQKRIEMMKRASMKDVNIVITQRVSELSGYGIANRDPSRRPKKHLESLDKREGTIRFRTEDMDGLVEVCLQSYTASPDTPSRVSVDIRVEGELEAEEMQEVPLVQLNASKVLEVQGSRITSELKRMERRASQILSNSEDAKGREETFHQKSVSLNKAVSYWPIFRIFILIVGGYLQVSHVIEFMKRRHIY